MPYTKFEDPWVDADSATGGGDESTPIPAAALDHIEDGIATAQSTAETADTAADAAQDDIDAHLVDTEDAHDASAVSVADAGGYFTGTDVEAALQELGAGGGGVDWMIVFTALSNEPPASGFATLDTRNSHAVLDFDAASEESAIFRGVLHPGYGGAGVNVKLIWAASTATSGNVRWATAFERIPAGALDIDADSFASVNLAVAAADGTSGETTETTIAHSDGAEMDSLAAGEMFRLRVYRTAADGADTMTGDAELLAVVITEQ